MKTTAVLLALCLLAPAAAAPAQNAPKTGEFGFDLALTEYSDLPLDSDPGFRLRVGVGITPRVGMEFRYARFDGTVEGENANDTTVQSWSLGVLWNFRPRPKDVPYAILALRRDDFTRANPLPSDVEGWEIGGGWRHWWNPRFGIRGEAVLQLRGEDNTIWDALVVDTVDFSANVGVSVSIGKKAKLAVPPREKKTKEKSEEKPAEPAPPPAPAPAPEAPPESGS